MAPEPDPYRILGLTRGASPDEIKRAYRQLAKAHHPDAAGERNVARFLAIQAAYERLIDGLDGSPNASRRTNAPRRPWDADPDRSDATRRAYGGRARPRASGTRPPGKAAGAGAEPGPAPEATGEGPSAKATPGSTSYDGADATPFEPDWGGASWYGTTSGTYWTLNPKEYADPRKHGPEYQARARRSARDRNRDPAEPTAKTADPAAETVDPRPPPDPQPDATHTTSSWWESTAGPGTAAPGAAGPGAAEPEATNRGPAASTSVPRPVPRPTPSASPQVDSPPDLGRAASEIGRALTDERFGGLRGRFARALIGWAPIALGLGWLVGELTGCGRFAATCDAAAAPITLGLQVLVLALLLVFPVAASVATMASITLLAMAVLAVLILSANGGEPDDARRATLAAVLVGAWLVGAGVAISQRVRARSSPIRPVSS